MTTEFDDLEIGDSRPIKQSVLRGWRRRCPACGSGPLMRDYLTVRKSCSVCSEELYHHRTDDGPAWATILISGHILAPLMLLLYELFRPEGGYGAWVLDYVPFTGVVFIATHERCIRCCAMVPTDARVRRDARNFLGRIKKPQRHAGHVGLLRRI